jgi:hypothetical protein
MWSRTKMETSGTLFCFEVQEQAKAVASYETNVQGQPVKVWKARFTTLKLLLSVTYEQAWTEAKKLTPFPVLRPLPSSCITWPVNDGLEALLEKHSKYPPALVLKKAEAKPETVGSILRKAKEQYGLK